MSQIYWYWPNIIGYVRVFLSCAAFGLYRYPVVFVSLYVIGFILDAIDGHAARALGQCSSLGAVLDMVTDRFSTAGLVSILAILYPDFCFLFLLLNALDFCSHWFRMYSTLLRGSKSHKSDSTDSPILRRYYSDKIFMATLCIGQEMFYIFAYIDALIPGILEQYSPVPPLSIPGCVCGILLLPFLGKQYVNILQLLHAAHLIVEIDELEKRNNSSHQ